jgi:DNA-binding response OmpR family regulator
MAKVLLIGLEPASADQITQFLAGAGHEVETKPSGFSTPDIEGADVLFAGGMPSQYMPLLQRVRTVLPSPAFVVVTKLPETAEWLDALDAGATDYCSLPLSTRQLQWIFESALSKYAVAAV